MSKRSRLFSELVRKWVQKTWLGWWKIDIRYFSNKEYAKVRGYSKKHARNSVATCRVNWGYLEAFIDVNSSAIKNMNDEELEYAVVHELMHIFLNEMREKGIEHEERVATLLARSFILCGGSQLEELVESK